MLYIIKTNDLRYEHLKEFCKEKYKVIYDDNIPINYDIELLMLPLDGIDEFGFIKGTNLNLSVILESNKVKNIWCGKIKKKLLDITKKYNVKLYSFYNDLWYCSHEFNIKVDIIRFFLCEKYQQSFEELKILVVGNDYKAYLVSERLGCDIYDTGSISTKAINNINFDKYDAIIKFNNLDFDFNKIIIEMQEIEQIDLIYLLKNREVYYINWLQQQYLTKSSAKIMYDCMVRI